MQALTTSKFGDGVVLVNTTQANPKDKGDLILSTPHVIETLYFLGLASKKLDSLVFAESPLIHRMRNEKQGTILFAPGCVHATCVGTHLPPARRRCTCGTSRSSWK